MKQLYMNIAQQAAQMSRAIRLQVGAVIVKDDNIISFSWNGTPAGWDNECEEKEYCDPYYYNWNQLEIDTSFPYSDELGRYMLVTKKEVIHAEANAISKLAKNHASGDGANIFITHAPCIDCAKLIYGAGIKKVFFQNHYKNDEGIQFLKQCGVEVENV